MVVRKSFEYTALSGPQFIGLDAARMNDLSAKIQGSYRNLGPDIHV
jgi:hypothetical protein